VVRDRLRVGLGEPYGYVRAEAKPFQAAEFMSVERLADLLRERGPAVVLTGAGISTESGIPDFRSPGGLWAQFDPLDYGSIDSFRRDPIRVWEFYAPRFSMLAGAEPNAGHLALAELERLGHVTAVVTQNIDLLHERAGSREVVEVHGSIRTATCPGCGRVHPLAEVLGLLEGSGAPACADCGAILKPDVVFFGELLPVHAIERANELAGSASLMLVVGSALEVYPVAGLPLDTLRAGGALAIVNRGPTAMDAKATLKLDGSAGDLLPRVAEAVAA
jgi:NAD-dependent deacetylase